MGHLVSNLTARLSTPLKRLARNAALLLLPLVAACTVETSPGYVDGGRPLPPRPPMCTMEYAPVCGERGNSRQTFANACQARSRGFDIIGRGECRREPPPPPIRACTREYAPVCGERRGRLQTFPNACEADRQGFRVVNRGECRREPERPTRVCTMEYAPVCGERGGRLQTFPNACEARNANFEIVRPGECRR